MPALSFENDEGERIQMGGDDEGELEGEAFDWWGVFWVDVFFESCVGVFEEVDSGF